MKLRTLIAALALSAGLAVSVHANAALAVDIRYNDWDMPITGQLINGTTYVPLRLFFNQLGGSWVTWNTETRSATVKGNANATFYLDSCAARYNGMAQTLTGQTFAVNGTMYVPLRGLAGVLNCDISYDGALQRVTLSTPKASTSNDDAVYWLARIIEAESGAEPYNGKLAVGNVILNRVKSADFPSTIYGVIFDRKNGVQFTPVANGTIYNTPSTESIRAAKDCLSGVSVAGKCLYFFNPKTATKAGWIIQNCKYFASIGNHDFYLPN